MSLITLPQELFSCVLANIESRHTLCSLARCSRQSYLYTIPHLYRHVTVWEERRDWEEGNNMILRNVSSLLLGRPDLAGLVRCFEFRGAWEESQIQESEESQELESSETVEVDQTFKTAVSALSLSKKEEKKWLRQLSRAYECNPEAILALLLPALLGVEKLVLDLDSIFHTPYLEQTIIRAARRERPFDIQPPFKALTVFLQYDDYQLRLRSTCFIASLLMLPAIRVISGFVGSKQDGMDQPTYPIGENKNLIGFDSISSPLTSLYLSAYRLSIADLDHILRAPKALKDFVYTVGPSPGITFTDIRRALEPQKNCLERLGFYFDERCSEWMFRLDKENKRHVRYNPYSGSMISFNSFNTIKVFETAALFLDSTLDGPGLINTFPTNLETFHLTRCQSSFGGSGTESLLIAVENLLAQKSPQQMPSLKKLILEKGRRRGQLMKSGNLWTNVYDDGKRGLKLMDADEGNLGTTDHLWTELDEGAIVRLKVVAANQGVDIEMR